MITFRQLGETDLELLHGWLNQPHVSEWWGGPKALQKVRSDYLEPAPTDRTTYYVVDCDDAEIGLIQRYPWSAERPNYIQAIGALAGEVGIDYLIGVPALVGVGLGPRMIGTFLAERVFDDPQVTAVRTAVAVQNQRSWQCLERLGFERVDEKVLPDEKHPEYVLVLPRASWESRAKR